MKNVSIMNSRSLAGDFFGANPKTGSCTFSIPILQKEKQCSLVIIVMKRQAEPHMTIIPATQKESEWVRPIQFLEIGKLTMVPAPLLRITTCGLLRIEVVEEVIDGEQPLARYVSFAPDQLRGRGLAPALLLLKLLLSSPKPLLSNPERFASKDWLIQQFCRDRELFSNVRLDNIVSQLRSLLCPDAYEGLRTHLVAHVRSSPARGDGYQLAAYPLIWTNINSLSWNMEQGARMERFGDDPLPSWERSYTLVKRGIYLPDELYWASRSFSEGTNLESILSALRRLSDSNSCVWNADEDDWKNIRSMQR
jgi:hypothetical protein